MATQGLVSVVDGTGKVLFKVVAGCNGDNAETLAEYLREVPLSDFSLLNVVVAADAADFGCDECLVVMDRETEYTDFNEVLHPRFRETFDDPGFNPRWEAGLADYAVIIQVEALSDKGDA